MARACLKGVAPVALAAALLAGCGVPTRTGVTLDGPAPQRNTSGGATGVRPPSPTDARDARGLVMLYLRAAADGPGTAAERLRPFITPNANWQPGSDLTVVRMVAGPSVTPWSDRDAVKLTLQPVGMLTARGTITGVNRPQETIELNVVPNAVAGRDQPEGGDQPSLLISNPPRGMYVLSDAFGDNPDLAMYNQFPVYYWDTSGRTLIPDIRYLSRTLPADRRPTELVKLLITPPSDWLAPGLRPLPVGIALRSNVVVDSGRMIVDLSAQAATVDDLRQFAAQLTWSLRAVHEGSIELRIEGQVRLTARAADFPFANAAMALSKAPETFCITETVVRFSCAEDPQLPVLSSDANRGVLAAAVARDKQHAALVRSGPANRRTLWLGESGPGQPPVYTATTLSDPAMSRPVWLSSVSTPTPQGLVAAGGELHRFVAGAREPLSLNTGEARKITAVSVAPDGRRIALIADQKAYVAVLVYKGNTVSVAPPRRLPSALPDVSAVGWSRTDRVVLVGVDGGRYALTEITVSGVIEDAIPVELGDLPVTALVAYPDHPDDGSVRGRIMIEAGGVAQTVSFTRPDPITFQTTRTPPPSASPVAIVPVAPFFLD